ncbi:MAG: TIGR01244 family sulfur transferase [Woeseiaceae bacterium]|nr:TIGR01244 family sulfur transferase [Woeseiaceae bacterium]
MQIKQLSDRYAVSEQITAEDVRTLADAGFGTIICNRPDGEDPGQPTAAEIAAACEAAGVAFHHLPFQKTPVDEAIVAAFRDVLLVADAPVFGYCRSGQRSAYLWTLTNR